MSMSKCSQYLVTSIDQLGRSVDRLITEACWDRKTKESLAYLSQQMRGLSNTSAEAKHPTWLQAGMERQASEGPKNVLQRKGFVQRWPNGRTAKRQSGMQSPAARCGSASSECQTQNARRETSKNANGLWALPKATTTQVRGSFAWQRADMCFQGFKPKQLNTLT